MAIAVIGLVKVMGAVDGLAIYFKILGWFQYLIEALLILGFT